MSKVKSALALIALSILVAVLCFVCTVSFPMGIDYFNSVIAKTDKDVNFGGTSLDGTYNGGGYVAMYYPDGIISAQEFADNRDGIADEQEREEYKAKYAASPSGTLYYEIDKVCGEDKKTPSAEFAASFAETVDLIAERYEKLHLAGVRVDVADGYTVRISLPADMSDQGAVLQAFSYTGDISVGYGEDADSATTIMPRASSRKEEEHEIGHYITGFSSRVGADGTAYVIINFTAAGREVIATQTATAADSSSTMFFKIGDSSAIQLTVSEAIDESSLYISGSYTAQSAEAVAVAFDTALSAKGDFVELASDELYRFDALFGNDALLYLYIAFGVLFVGMTVFFFVRYHLLAFAHLYSFLLFFFPMALCVWAIPFLSIGVETFVGLMLAAVVLCVSNAVSYECARKEFALGKTMISSVKTGYKKCFWSVFDVHIALALFGFVTFFIALTGLSAFAFTFALGVVFSGVCALAVNRFAWAALMAQSKHQGRFCNFKADAAEGDDDE